MRGKVLREFIDIPFERERDLWRVISIMVGKAGGEVTLSDDDVIHYELEQPYLECFLKENVGMIYRHVDRGELERDET